MADQPDNPDDGRSVGGADHAADSADHAADGADHAADSADHAAIESLLRRALAVRDQVPGSHLDIAKGLFAWRGVDALIAEVTFDSAIDELAGVRGSLANRTVVFAVDEVEVEVVTADSTEGIGEPDRHLLVVHVEPPTPGMRLVLRHPGGVVQADVDEQGDAAFADVPQGPVQLTLHRPDAPAITTPAVPI